MAIEIERKFLVRSDKWRSESPLYFCQGYLNTDKQRTVRVRIAGSQGQLTIKSQNTGISRAEYEYPIPVEDAKELLKLCYQPLIEKYRHFSNYAGLTWEVDEFLGENAGLVVAEVELQSEEQSIDLPPWVGEEVSDDPRYFNSALCKHPFSQW